MKVSRLLSQHFQTQALLLHDICSIFQSSNPLDVLRVYLLLTQGVTLQTCIWDVSSLNLGWDTNYST
jgi:hypothetical protein